jgi:hypothetical protein
VWFRGPVERMAVVAEAVEHGHDDLQHVVGRAEVLFPKLAHEAAAAGSGDVPSAAGSLWWNLYPATL